MGGIIGLTIRFSRTNEYRGSCWTNVLPEGLFAAPFYLPDSRKHVEEWLRAIRNNRAKNPEVGSLWARHGKLAPIEYGLVVVDYVTDTLVSCQGYNSPAQIYAIDTDDGPDPKWAALERAGLLTLDSEARAHRHTKIAEVKLPFAHVVLGMERECDRTVQAWCEEHFGLSDDERACWAAWHARFADEEG